MGLQVAEEQNSGCNKKPSKTLRARLSGENAVSHYSEACRNGQKHFYRIHACGKQLWFGGCRIGTKFLQRVDKGFQFEAGKDDSEFPVGYE